MSYGNYWKKYPIERGETWRCDNMDVDGVFSEIKVADITEELPYFFTEAGICMLYSDTPWSLSNVNMFNKKAGRAYMNDFAEFYRPLFQHIAKINPRVCYLEIGKQERENFIHLLKAVYPAVQEWQITYYGKNSCYLLRGGASQTDFDFAGMDDKDTPLAAIRQERPFNVADFCTGRGLTGIAALKEGCNFFGTEMNKEKLAVFIHRAKRLGYVFSKVI